MHKAYAPASAVTRTLTLTLTLTLALTPLSLTAQNQAEIRWSDFTLEVGDSAVAAQVGRLAVPERHGTGPVRIPAGKAPGDPGSGIIELAFVRLATRAAKPGPPIVYLDGGPGGSGFGIARTPAYFRLFDALRDVADVILVSQRGTGLSRPWLACPSSAPAPADFFTTRERMLEILRPEVAACADRFRQEGVDLGAYNTRESADDLESLRQALGADSLSLLAFSYGTHLGLSALRRHGDRIARAVLIGTEGPDESLKLPSTGDLQLHHLAALAAADPGVGGAMPDLYAAVDTLLRRLDAEPVALDIQARSGPLTIPLGGDGMRYLLRRDLGDTNDHPLWPATVRTALDGNWRLVTRLAQRRFNELGGVPLMATLVDCASGASAPRMARILADRPGTLFGDMMDNWDPDLCDVVPEAALDDAFRARFTTRVPTLFLAGTLDANTPPYQAYDASWGWPNATVVVVDRSGHETLMPWSPAQEVIVDFFAGEDVRARRLELPPTRFVSIEEVRAEQRVQDLLRNATRRLLVAVALQDGRVTPEERTAVGGGYQALFGQGLDNDAVDAEVRAAGEDGRRALEFARDAALHFSDRVKAIALQSLRRVAAADENEDDGERRLLADVGAALGMSADAIREVLAGG